MIGKMIAGAALLLLCAAQGAQAATYHVGANRDSKTLGAVLGKLKPGDIVEVDPGTYPEVDNIMANGTREAPITIRGAAGQTRPIFDADGKDTSGRGSIPRGVFQVEGAYIVLEHLEFKNARNGNNAAGVRLNDSTNAVIRDCKVTYCDMGIFGGDHETALIDRCEVAFNGTSSFNGGSHNFYMHGNRVVVRDSYIHDSLFGQNYKSRAHYNELWNNWIVNSEEGEVGCVDAAGNTDKPNSNVLMVGNTIISRPDRTGNGQKYVLFGSELGASHNGTLYMFHNTCVAGTNRIKFITLDDPQARAVVSDNVFTGAGSPNMLFLPRKPISITASHNLLPTGTALPEGWNEQSTGPLTYVDGDGATHTLPAAYAPAAK